MSKRRTRRQKIASGVKKDLNKGELVEKQPHGIDKYLKVDLTRTVLVTILALFLEIMLKLYLERG